MSGIILCDDILGIVGKEVKEIRDQETLKYHMDIWETGEPFRGWWCLLSSNHTPPRDRPTMREKTLNAVEQIGSGFMISDDDNELRLKHKLEAVNDFSLGVNDVWIDYNHYNTHGYLANYNRGQPKVRVSLDNDDGEILFVY